MNGGLYSDEAVNGTVGKQFLRGYQVTDANGAVQFQTIYPGWYSGRTIHIHFRIRTFAGTTTSTNFALQLFFDDAVSNQVLAKSPYDTRGTRNTTNANDTIYQSATLLALTSDGNGGYVGAFTVALPSDGGPVATRIAFPRAWRICLFIPREPLATEKARAVLSPNVSRADAVFNIAHAAALLAAILRSDGALLSIAMADRLHQPARAHLVAE